ncbi:PIN domain-containing protein [Nocardia suismassiliense]|uniref:PIN domain-containing protein n=1 Tax=Nocardia suismassiliense TaxID=2077092 RepID=UPI000D1EBC9B|nr:PIN domain-containing protein [Nocardia suismassiliense]
MKSERVFIDTNVLIYAYEAGDDRRSTIAREVLADLWERKVGLLSTQVLQEFYSVATRKLRPKLSPAEVRRIIALYSEWCARDTDPLILMNASFLAETHSVSWWDALIVEAASQSGAKYILSEDLQHGRSFLGLEVRNPFLERAG